MSNVTKRFLPGLVLMLALNQCSDKQPTKPTIDWRDTLTFVETPTDDFEAETAAYSLSGTRLAPLYLYEKIKSELDIIRTQHDSVPGVRVEYIPFYPTSQLLALFDSVVTDSIRAGTYDAWDSLNDFCRLDSLYFQWRDYIILQFEGHQNPSALYDLYEDLPGLQGVGRFPRGGDWPQLLLKMEGREIKYFFREAWGDCPSGCINSKYSYLTVSDQVATFHGSYQYTYPPDSASPPPAWMDTARQAHDDYFFGY